MKKSFIYIVLTILVEVGLSFAVSSYFNTALIPVMFFIGLLSIALVMYFTSSGSVLSNYTDSITQAQTGIAIKSPREDIKLKGSPALWGTSFYFVISIVLFVLYLQGIL